MNAVGARSPGRRRMPCSRPVVRRQDREGDFCGSSSEGTDRRHAPFMPALSEQSATGVGVSKIRRLALGGLWYLERGRTSSPDGGLVSEGGYLDMIEEHEWDMRE